MKKILYIMAATMMLLCTTSCTKESYEGILASISGTVRDKATGEPLSNVLLTLTPDRKNTYTGMDGSYQFDDLEATTYDIQVQKTGYGSTKFSVKTEAGKTSILNILMDKNE